MDMFKKTLDGRIDILTSMYNKCVVEKTILQERMKDVEDEKLRLEGSLKEISKLIDNINMEDNKSLD